MSDIKIVRLVTGEVLVGKFEQFIQTVGKFEQIAQSSYRLIHPFLIGIQPAPNGNVTVNLVPYLPFTDDDVFDINADMVIHINDANKGLAEKVNSMIASARSGLVLPNKPTLLT